MLTVEHRTEPPQVVIQVGGSISIDDLHEVVRQYAEVYDLPAEIVILIEYVAPSTYHPTAAGVVLFLIKELLTTEPKAVLIVAPGNLEMDSVAVRELRSRSSDAPGVHFFETRAAADAFVQSL